MANTKKFNEFIEERYPASGDYMVGYRVIDDEEFRIPLGYLNTAIISDRFIRKDIDDYADGIITFNSGLKTAGDVYSTIFLQGLNGWRVDSQGNLEVNSIVAREFIETPELRKNRITVMGNQFWFTDSALIRLVTATGNNNYDVYFKLEDGEYGSFVLDDIVKGIFHYDTGFYTTYLRVYEEILDENNGQIGVKMTTLNNRPPMAHMLIARMNNASNKNRQGSIFADGLNKYIRVLNGFDSSNPTSEGSMDTLKVQIGDLSSIENSKFGEPLEGYGLYAENVYLTGRMIIKNDPNAEGQILGVFRGLWSADETYFAYDQASYKGSLYSSRLSNNRNNVPVGDEDDPWWELVVSQGPSGSSGAAASIIDLTNDNTTIPVDYDGLNPVLFDTNGDPIHICQANVYQSTTDISELYNFTYTAGPNITITTISEADPFKIAITGLDNTSTWKSSSIQITATPRDTSSEYATLNTTWSISLVRAGEPGETPTAYWIITDSAVIKKYKNGTFSPNPFIARAKSKMGEGPIEDLSGYWRLTYGTTSTTSVGTTLSIVPLSTVTSYTIELYLDQEMSVLLDKEIIHVVEDGTDGDPGVKADWQIWIFYKGETQPGTPLFTTPPTSYPVSGWYDYPNSDGIWWMSTAIVDGPTNAIKGQWSTPIRMVGIDGEDGAYYVNVYQTSATQPSTPTGSTIPPTNWSLTPTAPTATNPVWVSQVRVNSDSTVGTWSTPMRWSGYNGVDGTDVEFIFTRTATETRPPTPGGTTPVQQDDYVPTGWTDDPVGPTSTLPYEWISTRYKTNGTWGLFSTPSMWARWSFDGEDGVSVRENFVLDSAKEVTANNTYTLTREWNSFKDKKVTISFYYEYSNVATGTADNQRRFGFERSFTSGGQILYGLSAWVVLPASSSNLSGSGRYENSYTIPADAVFSIANQIGYYKQVTSGNVKIWNVKIEEGSPASAWSPAWTELGGNSIEQRFRIGTDPLIAPSIVVTDRAPAGWSLTNAQTLQPGEYLWMTSASISPLNALIGQWSTPWRVSAEDGGQGPSPVVPSLSSASGIILYNAAGSPQSNTTTTLVVKRGNTTYTYNTNGAADTFTVTSASAGLTVVNPTLTIGATSLTWTATAVSATAGYIDITVVPVGGTSQTLRFNVVRVNNGQDGTNGTSGNSIELRYRAHTSSTTAPSIVVSDRNPANWTVTPPAITASQYLWMTQAAITPANTLATQWSAPVRNSGVPGPAGENGQDGASIEENLFTLSDSADRTNINSNNSTVAPISKTYMSEGVRNYVRVKRVSSTDNTYISLYNSIPLSYLTQSVVGKQVTISFDARCSHVVNGVFMKSFYDPNTTVSNADVINLTKDWKRYYWTYTIPADLTGGIRFCPYYISLSGIPIADFYLDISRYKVSFGDVQDAWSPAWSDLDGQDAYSVLLSPATGIVTGTHTQGDESVYDTTKQINISGATTTITAYKGATTLTHTTGTPGTGQYRITITQNSSVGWTGALTNNVFSITRTQNSDVDVVGYIDKIIFTINCENKVSFTMTYPILFNAQGAQGVPGPVLDWVQNWDGTKVVVGGNYILSPRIFAGTVDKSTGRITQGIALGTDVFRIGTTQYSGLVGVYNGALSFWIKPDGEAWFYGNVSIANKILLKQDGSGFVASNNFSWDISGNITAQNMTVNSGTFKGNVSIANKIMLNTDGSGYIANGNFRWTTEGVIYHKAPLVEVWRYATEITSAGLTVDLDTTKGLFVHAINEAGYGGSGYSGVLRLPTPSAANEGMQIKIDSFLRTRTIVAEISLYSASGIATQDGSISRNYLHVLGSGIGTCTLYCEQNQPGTYRWRVLDATATGLFYITNNTTAIYGFDAYRTKTNLPMYTSAIQTIAITNSAINNSNTVLLISSSSANNGIYRILDSDGLAPTNGEIKVLINVGSNNIFLRRYDLITGGNIRFATSGNYIQIVGNQAMYLIGYNGDWYVHNDWGQ